MRKYLGYRIQCCYRISKEEQKSSAAQLELEAAVLNEWDLFFSSSIIHLTLFGSVCGPNCCIVFMLLLLYLKTSEDEDCNLPVEVLK